MAWWDTPIKQAMNNYNMANKTQNLYNQLEFDATQGNKKGDFYGLLGRILSQQLSDGAPNIDEYRQNVQGAIKKNAKLNQTQLNESFASRGMGNSGAAMAAQAMLSGETSQALGQSEVDLANMNESYKQDAISKLLGLNALSSNVDQNKFSNLMSLFQTNLNQLNFNREMQYKEDNTPSSFAQLLGSLLGAGTSVATTGFMTNWGKGNG